ncbi:MAG TPA: L,D-transpeptidase family protein, partial [Syntrophales bacterium]|nr:L,D-transpeptidase family protein [Syntrophales bacterium]
SIVRKEIIPKVKRNPGYLSSEQIRIYQDWRPGSKEISPGSLDWKKIDPRSFPYHLIQDPGPKNPLGRIKFLFPNSHDVYMHDTPSRHLFNRQGRTFSHGCIRLEKPIDLAEYLLRNDTGWKKAQIMKKINSGQRLLIALRNPIPVHLVYFTVWSDETGLVYFRDDLYEYDRYLGKAMNHQQGKTGGFLF